MLPRLRDELGVSRRDAKAFLDHFDSAGLMLRRPDNTRPARRAALNGPRHRQFHPDIWYLCPAAIIYIRSREHLK
jgi:hypothetical protein